MRESDMLGSKMRMAAMGATAAVLSCGMVGAANADMIFHNSTDVPIHFGITCTGDHFDWRTVSPHATDSLVCVSGSERAMVEIRTDRGSVDHVVHAIVHDGDRYRLDYDGEGDVNIF
jgi:hypothetical protein